MFVCHWWISLVNTINLVGYLSEDFFLVKISKNPPISDYFWFSSSCKKVFSRFTPKRGVKSWLFTSNRLRQYQLKATVMRPTMFLKETCVSLEWISERQPILTLLTLSVFWWSLCFDFPLFLPQGRRIINWTFGTKNYFRNRQNFHRFLQNMTQTF